MANIGLLLTPETLTFQEFLEDGARGMELTVAQRRTCFTELAPSELAQHGLTFGPFALEFDGMKLRELGAMPVFYVPVLSREAGLASAAVSLLSRIGETVDVLNRLAGLAEFVKGKADDETVRFTMGGSHLDSRLTVAGLRDLLQFLSFEVQHHQTLAAALDVAGSLFYPTDNLHQGDLLGYYRQREWRLVSGIAYHGRRHDRPLTEEEKEAALSIDGVFFGRPAMYRISRIPLRVAESRRVDNTFVYVPPEGRGIFEYVTRVVVPEGLEGEAMKALTGVKCNVVCSSAL